jgi:hypothetical protein
MVMYLTLHRQYCQLQRQKFLVHKKFLLVVVHPKQGAEEVGVEVEVEVKVEAKT